MKWAGIREKLQAQHDSDRRQAEAAEKEKRRVAEERAKKQKEDDARQERLRTYALAKSRYDNEIFELSRVVRKLTADLKRFQDQDDEDMRKERERNGWFAYLTRPLYGKNDETDEQKQERETKRLHRLASRSIKGSELREKEAKLQNLQMELQDLNSNIAAEKKKAEDERKRLEDEARASRLRMEQEERDRWLQEIRERMAKAQKEASERAAREAREAEAARKAQESQERVRMAAAAAERRRREEEQAQALREAVREAEEAARRNRETWNNIRSKPPKKSICRHDRFWPKIEGSQPCSKCHETQRRFAFQCPGCRMIACANCRQSLRGEKPKKGGGSGGRRGFTSKESYSYNDDYAYDYD